MKFQTLFTVFVLTAALSACSSSSGGGGEASSGGSDQPTGGTDQPTGGTDQPTSGGASLDDALSLVSSFGEDGENLRPVSADDLPDRAEMNGYMAVGPEDSSILVLGDASATADFSAGRLSGTADDFVQYEEAEACETSIEACTGTAVQDVDGSMTISGTITGTTFTFDTSGTLSLDDLERNREEITASIDVSGNGEFSTLDGNLVAVGAATGLFDVKRPSETESIEGDVLLWLVD